MTQFFNRNRWWITRTLALPLHIAVFASAAFFLVRLVPGDPVLARMDTSGGFSKAAYDAAAKSMGLYGSIWSQFGGFWDKLIHLDLGTSPVTGRTVWTEVMSRLPGTLELVLIGLLGSAVLALILALITMSTSNRRLHTFLRSYGRLAGAVPDFAFAILGLVLLYTVLRIIPAPVGRTDPGQTLPDVTGFPLLDCAITGNWAMFGSICAHYALPVFVIVVTHTPSLWKQLCLGVEDQVVSPTTLFKVASGATRTSIYLSILRRASASSIVMLGAMLGGLVGSVIVIEQLFGFGGVGQFAIDSVTSLDFVGLQGFLVIIAGVCLIIFFLVDIVNMLLDPRRRPGARTDG